MYNHSIQTTKRANEITLLLITTDKSHDVVFEDANIKVINIYEWLLLKNMEIK